ncbi:uncharacterized membrane-anchored protein YitT (DUF2179 family) [Natranaerovirga pectinivora]|uniref:Uncharacterized membrane-anchored protein YitT (DUF2179 family) n=1 Tax=Natranaerovirga pectinivora TaxID=682400 RepID=A0A4R3MJB4_9FIRM|nr:YitT family protein [Natranaerovirga pectinivora]TCT14113.1 uncharacterized membrane-anchored protein YitT (DUF2179 family) [Natranaerovirga pectinivora]
MNNLDIHTNRHPIYEFLLIVIGTLLLAISINVFFDPMNLVIGGVTGLAIVIKSISLDVLGFEIPIWLTNIAINIPLFVVAIYLKGKSFGRKTFFATVVLTVGLYYTEGLPLITQDILLATVYGGIVAGVGLGLVFQAFATTGGTDLAASIAQHYLRHLSVARIMLFLDGIIVISGAFVFGPENALYAILSIFITTKIIDGILEGVHFSKAAFIISDEYEEIAASILLNIDRGVTGINGKGMFSTRDKQILLCVVSKKEIVKLKELVKEIDRKAFVIVADVKEVLGEGFIEYKQ